MVYALLAFIVVRELIFWVNHQKLINKLMSRDFYSYKLAQEYRREERKPKAKPEPKLDPGINSLTEFTG